MHFLPSLGPQITYEDLANAVGEVVGKPVTIEYYNPKDFDLPKGAYPFRATSFYVDVDKAKSVLGWSPANAVKEDLKWYFEDYKALGCDQKDVDFTSDEQVSSAPHLSPSQAFRSKFQLSA